MKYFKVNILFIINLLSLNCLIAQDCPPELVPSHIERPDDVVNLIRSGNFEGSYSTCNGSVIGCDWWLTDCEDQEAPCELMNQAIQSNGDGNNFLLFDKRISSNCYDRAIQERIDLKFLEGETEPVTFTLSFKARTKDDFPSPIIIARILYRDLEGIEEGGIVNGANHTLLSERFVVSENNTWQECVGFFKIDPNEMKEVALDISYNVMVSDICNSIEIDDIYLGRGKWFENAPNCKDPFNGTSIQIDELGNCQIKENGKWKNFFPIGMMGGNYRPDFQLYVDNGFNHMARQYYIPYINKIKETDPPLYYSFSLDRWLDCTLEACTDLDICPYGCPTCVGNTGSNLETHLTSLFNDPDINDKLLYYYIDNEDPNYLREETIKNVSNNIECIEQGFFGVTGLGGESQKHPLYLLNGTPGIARQYKAHSPTVDVADITGTYINNSGSTTKFDLINNIDGQRMPVVLAQINEVEDNSMGAKVFAAIAHGAKGISYLSDKGGPGAPSSGHDVTAQPWWDRFDEVTNDINDLLPLIREPHWTKWTASHDRGCEIDFGTRNFEGEGYIIAANLEDEVKVVNFTIENLLGEDGLGYIPTETYVERHSLNSYEGYHNKPTYVAADGSSINTWIVLEPFGYGVFRLSNELFSCPSSPANLNTKKPFIEGLEVKQFCTSSRIRFMETVVEADRYQFRYSFRTNGIWGIWRNSLATPNNTININNIPSGTNGAKVRMRIECNGVWSGWSDVEVSAFPSCKRGPDINMNKIEVYPNPANQQVSIGLNGLKFEKGSVSIFDLSGKEVKENTLIANQSKTILNTNDIANGIYLIKIKTDGKEIHTQKLTIAH